ncbi:MAG: hypothetical protein EAX86_07630 [Candidatus Heimdallarchaeota archaeon]|nr:hypothetical protein [Candidatus Heimdallarchaeota archaeon]
MARGNKYETDPKLLDVLLETHRPLSVSELGRISGLGRDKARSFTDRIILGKAGVPPPPGVRIVDILMSRVNSNHHFRFVGIKDESYWKDWLNQVTKEGYRIARDHFDIFPNYELDPALLDTIRKNVSAIKEAAGRNNRSPERFLDEMLAYVLHPNFEKGRSLLNIIAAAAQSNEDQTEKLVALRFLSRSGFIRSQSNPKKEDS